MKTLKIYLSGSTRKGESDNRGDDFFWSELDESKIKNHFKNLKVELFNPNNFNIDRSDPLLTYNTDLLYIKQSDLILVDGRFRKGIGVGAEMLYARSLNKIVITICPPNSHYRKEDVKNLSGQDIDNWVHPFLFSMSNIIVDTLNEAIIEIEKLLQNGMQITENNSSIKVISKQNDK